MVLSLIAAALVGGAVPGGPAPTAAWANDVTPPPAPPPPETPIVGFAETHLHQFANRGFGGLEIWGSPMDPGLDPTVAIEAARRGALPDSNYLYVSDAAVDGILGAGGVSARFNPSSSSCTSGCPAACPPGTGTTGNPCWQVAIHGADGSLDLLNRALGGEDAHGTMGYPDMAGWPAWDVYTTQQVYYEWLKRAHDHGLKLMFMHAVNNALLCNLGYHLAAYGCDDDPAVARQIEGAKQLEAYVDARAGGPGQGFYRVVYSGDQARQAIKDGKLAVVLGAEVDTPGGCTVGADFCTGSYIESLVQHYYDMGIRVFYPVHVTDNRFGGAALYTPLFDFDNLATNGHFFDVTTDCPAGIEFRMTLREEIAAVKPLVIAALALAGPITAAVVPLLAPIVAGLAADPLIQAILPLLGGALAAAAPALAAVFPLAALVFLVPDAPGASNSAPTPPDPNCNARGLTDDGATLINALMDHGMLIDVDHTSARTFDGILDIAEARHYAGIVSGHTGLVGSGLTRAESEAAFPGTSFDLGGSARSEGNKTDAQVQRIAALGGVVSLIPHQGGRTRIREFASSSGPPVPFTCGESSQAWAQVYLYATRHLGLDAVGVGSDMNGLAGMPAPRFGPRACAGEDPPSAEATRSPTQFQDYFGVTVTPQTFGNRTWDYNEDGLAQVGQYPEFINDLGLSHGDLGPLFSSAESDVLMWEKVDDHAAPQVACGTVGEDWHATDVRVPCVAWDTGSGLANATDASFTLSTSVPPGTETGNAITGTHPSICDRAGNCTGSVPGVSGINVDKKAPSVMLTNPVDGATYIVHENQPADFACSDGGSGVATCTAPVLDGAPIDTSVGTHVFTVTGIDRVGNSAQAAAAYAVTYRLCLLHDPDETRWIGPTARCP